MSVQVYWVYVFSRRRRRKKWMDVHVPKNLPAECTPAVRPESLRASPRHSGPAIPVKYTEYRTRNSQSPGIEYGSAVAFTLDAWNAWAGERS